MDLDTECIPLAHIQMYFDLRKSLVPDVDWLLRRSRLPVNNPHELLEFIVGIDQHDFYRNAGIDYRPGDNDRFISTRQTLALVDQAVRALEMPYLGLAMGNLMTISHHGMAGVAAVTQPTLRGCLETIARFCSELFPALEMNGHVEDGEGMFTMAEAGRVVTDWVGDPGAVLEYGVRFAAMVPVPDDDTGTTLTVGGRVEEKLDNRQVAVVLEAKALDASVLSKARAVVQLS